MATTPDLAWAERAGELAAWADRFLVNRRDVWGGYWRDEAGLIHPTTRPQKGRRPGDLSADVLRRHFLAEGPYAVVGLHTTSPANECRWIGLDLDAHGPGANPEGNEQAATHWWSVLLGWDVPAILTASNGAGGFHVRGLFDPPIPSADAHALACYMVADHARFGLTAPPEVFPKQPALSPPGTGRGEFGNWLRLPGRHPKRGYWSAVRGPDGWLAGSPAVSHLLSLTGGGKPPGLVVANAHQFIEDSRRPPAPPRSITPSLDADARYRRVRKYMERVPHLSEGQGRDCNAYRLAAVLVENGLSDDEARPFLEQWDAGNDPPKGARRLAEILENARRYSRSGGRS